MQVFQLVALSIFADGFQAPCLSSMQHQSKGRNKITMFVLVSAMFLAKAYTWPKHSYCLIIVNAYSGIY
jgi:hypothetical protein